MDKSNQETSRREFLRVGIALLGGLAVGMSPLELLAKQTKDSKESADKGYHAVGKLRLRIVDPSETGMAGEYEDPCNTGVPLIYVPRDMLGEKVTDNFTLGELTKINNPSNLKGKKVPHHEVGGSLYNQYVRIDSKLPIELQKLRETIGMSLTVLSPYRSMTYNHNCGGRPKSRHPSGQAADLTCKDVKKLYDLAINQFDKGGVGYYPKLNFVHVDVRGFRARWNG